MKQKILQLIDSTIEDIIREFNDRTEFFNEEEYKIVRYTKQDIIVYQKIAMQNILEELENKIKRW